MAESLKLSSDHIKTEAADSQVKDPPLLFFKL